MSDWDGKTRRQSDVDLSDIKTSLALIHQDVTVIRDEQKRHGEILYGKNGHASGLIIELDRLKEHKKSSEKHAAVAWSAFIGLLAKSVWDWILKK